MPDLASALARLYERAPLGMVLGLDAMRAACGRAGNPERAFPAVHVAGTNGKGSTSAMLESIARAAGLRTGLYTSPHLVRFVERIRVDGAPAEDAAFASALHDALLFGPELSFFEVATLAAFLVFARARLDLAVVEVGLGGRLDATNVLPSPRAGAITRIALDHEAMLGSTLEEIAREKAGIAKAGMPVVLGPLDGSVREAAAATIEAAGGVVLPWAPEEAIASDAALGLEGLHQRENARVAWAVADVLGLPPEARARGLAAVRWPGRLERLDVPLERGSELAGPWLLDGAHNPDGAEALVRALASSPVAPRALVFGALADKPWPSMLDALRPLDVPRVYVAPGGRAPAEPEALAAVLPGTPARSLREGLAFARAAAGANGLVVVSGSLYLVGAARALLLDLTPDPSVGL